MITELAFIPRALPPLSVITRRDTALEKNAIKLELIFHIGLVICQIYERILYGWTFNGSGGVRLRRGKFSVCFVKTIRR